MNNENNNLNGVVLGNVTNPNGVSETPNTNSQVINPGNTVMMPNSEVVTPSPIPAAPPQSQEVNTNVGPVSVEPVMPDVVMPGAVNSGVQEVEPTPVNVNPVNNATPVNNGQTISQPPIENKPIENAYTNVNSINPNSVSNNSIGTNPPISLNSEKTPKKKGNKTLFVIIVLLLLIGVGLGTYYVLNYTDLLVKKSSVNISTKNMTLNVGDSISNNVNDFATITGTSSNNCILNTNNIDLTKEGTYKFTVTCSNIVKEGTVTVVDNKPINIETQTVYSIKGEQLEAKMFVKNLDDDLIYEIDNKSEIENVDLGTYTVKIKASNSSGKEANAEAKLVILEYKVKGYTVCTMAESEIEKAIMTRSTKLAIVEDGNNSFGNIVLDIYAFKYNDKEEYDKLVNEYLENKTLTINDITGDVDYNDSTQTIIITKELDAVEIKSTYGDNVPNHGAIRTYFTQSLGYQTCTYEKANN